MTQHHDDDELRDLFAKARAQETPWTPGFERVRAGRSARSSPRRSWSWVIATAGVVVVGLGVAFLNQRRLEMAESVPSVLGQWRSATDFLLDTEGAEFLNSVPRIGDVNDWFSLEGMETGSRL